MGCGGNDKSGRSRPFRSFGHNPRVTLSRAPFPRTWRWYRGIPSVLSQAPAAFVAENCHNLRASWSHVRSLPILTRAPVMSGIVVPDYIEHSDHLQAEHYRE